MIIIFTSLFQKSYFQVKMENRIRQARTPNVQPKLFIRTIAQKGNCFTTYPPTSIPLFFKLISHEVQDCFTVNSKGYSASVERIHKEFKKPLTLQYFYKDLGIQKYITLGFVDFYAFRGPWSFYKRQDNLSKNMVW